MTTLRMNRQGLLTLPGIIFSVFPTLVCPACWPAYAGLLAAFGQTCPRALRLNRSRPTEMDHIRDGAVP